MKRLILPLILIAALSSCGKLPIQTVRPSFASDSIITAQYMQSEFTARIIMDENTNITAEIQQPDILSGIRVECSGNGVKAICGNVEIDSVDGYYPFEELYKVICSINTSEPASTQKNDDGYTFIYKYEGEQYTVTTNSAGTIKYINTSTCEFEKR